MKKIITLMFVVMLFIFGACNSDRGNNLQVPDSSEKVEPTACEIASTLINEGKIKEAYSVLYAEEDDNAAKEMLSEFTVVYGRIVSKSYNFYNYIIEKTYNDNGDLLTEHSPSHKDYDYNTECKYTYDENGKKLICQKKNVFSTVTIEYVYDNNGNLILETETSESGYNKVIERQYDEKGRKVYEVEKNADGIICELKITYDEKGRIIYEEWFNTENNQYKKTIEYEGDNPIKIIEMRPSITKTSNCNEHGDVVKTITVSENIEYGSAIEESFDFEYDENGLVAKKISHMSDGRELYETFVYDEKGYIIEQSEVVNEKDYYVSKTQITYSDAGKIAKEVITQNSWSESYADYEYDLYGNLISESNADGKRSYEYTYDEKGKMLTKISHPHTGENNKKATKSEYIYDDSGVLEKVQTFYEPYNENEKNELFYDKNGNLIKEVDSFETTEYTYNEHGDMTRKYTVSDSSEVVNDINYTYTYDDNNNVIMRSPPKVTYEYNDKNRLGDTVYYDNNGNITSKFLHNYDSRDNITEVIFQTFKDGKVNKEVKNVFTYDENGNKTSELREEKKYNFYGWYYEYSDYEYYYTPNH